MVDPPGKNVKVGKRLVSIITENRKWNTVRFGMDSGQEDSRHKKHCEESGSNGNEEN